MTTLTMEITRVCARCGVVKPRVQPWRKKRPEADRAIVHRRRARQKAAAGHCNAQQLQWRIEFYGGLCYICRAPWEHIDHVKPLSKGGSNWPANLRPTCGPCNLRKGAKH